MAKLIKSVLANRMMFRGGGLVAPNQAAGILASSAPLMNSVAMNEGGSVNYANGGTVGPRSFPEIPIGGAPQDLQITESIKNIPSAIRGIPSALGDAVSDFREATYISPRRATEIKKDIANIPGDVAGNVTETIMNLIQYAASTGNDAVDLVSKQFGIGLEAAENAISSVTDSIAGEMPDQSRHPRINDGVLTIPIK